MIRSVLLRADTVGGADDLRAFVAEADRQGFHGVEWVVADASGAMTLPSGVAELEVGDGPDAVRHRPRLVHSVSWALATVHPAEAIDETVRLLTAVQGRCIGSIALSIPPLTPAKGEPGFPSYQDALNYAYQVLRGLRFEAESAGVRIAIEAARGGCLLSPVEVRDLIDAVNSSAIGACLDVDLVSRVGDPLDWLATLGARVGAVRVGYSTLPVEPLAAALDDLRFDGPVVVRQDVSVDDRPGLIAKLYDSSGSLSRNLLRE